MKTAISLLESKLRSLEIESRIWKKESKPQIAEKCKREAGEIQKALSILKIKSDLKKSFNAILPHVSGPCKVHVMYMLPSYYNDVELVIYRYFSKNNGRWVEKMCTYEELISYRDRYEIT